MEKVLDTVLGSVRRGTEFLVTVGRGTLKVSLLAAIWLEATLGGAEPRQWPVELKVGRFEIHADFDVSLAPQLRPELSILAADVHELLEINSSEQPVHVVLFATGHEYQRYMRNYFPQLPERRALFIQDRGPGMLFAHWHADVISDLRHEITHALLNDGSQPLPLWLDEGLAEYFEVERQQRLDGNAYVAEVSRRAAEGIAPSLKQLEEIDQLQYFKEPQYRDSWAWVHFLLHRSAITRQILKRYLAELRSGGQPMPLWRQLSNIADDASGEFLAHFGELATVVKDSNLVQAR